MTIWLLAGQVSCGSIAAWWNNRGPSFLMQDDDTGGIRYSLCNGNHTPIFSDDKTLTTPFSTYLPKNKTSLAATGWMDGETTWASIFYLDNNDEIVNALLKCDWNTGHWLNTGEYVTSSGAPKVAPESGLSAVLLGATDGYRVFYNDLEGSLHQIGYTSTSSWAYYGVVSNDKMSTQGISSAFYNKNITVVRPRDDKNMGVSRLYSDQSWHISTFPESLTLSGNKSTNATAASDLKINSTTSEFSLPAWDGNASAVALGIDSDYTRSVFYIGTDKKLYQIGNKNYTWSVFDRPGDNMWPEADVASGPIGIASDFSTNIMRLYYMSGGRMIEVDGDNGNWQTATVLASVNQTQVTDTPSSTPTGNSPSAQGNGGLSDGAKAGISVGVTLGVIAVGGMLFAFLFLRRRQKKLDDADAAAAAAAAGSDQQHMSPNSGYTAPTTAFSQAGPQGGNHDGYPPQQTGYTPLQTEYAQQAGYPQPMAYNAVSADGQYAQPAPVHPYPQQQVFSQDGGWTYATPTTAQNPQQPYYYQNQYPQEMADQRRPVEMMGEGHYKEAP